MAKALSLSQALEDGVEVDDDVWDEEDDGDVAPPHTPEFDDAERAAFAYYETHSERYFDSAGYRSRVRRKFADPTRLPVNATYLVMAVDALNDPQNSGPVDREGEGGSDKTAAADLAGKTVIEYSERMSGPEFQSQFLKVAEAKLAQEGANVLDIQPAPTDSFVVDRFLGYARSRKILPTVVGHGTRRAVFPSIFRNGLLIPGQGNNLPVRNGKVHGPGVYSATSVSGTPVYYADHSNGRAQVLLCALADPTESVSNAVGPDVVITKPQMERAPKVELGEGERDLTGKPRRKAERVKLAREGKNIKHRGQRARDRSNMSHKNSFRRGKEKRSSRGSAAIHRVYDYRIARDARAICPLGVVTLATYVPTRYNNPLRTRTETYIAKLDRQVAAITAADSPNRTYVKGPAPNLDPAVSLVRQRQGRVQSRARHSELAASAIHPQVFYP